MNICPRCQVRLAVVELEGVPLETCDRCAGHWIELPHRLKQIIDARKGRLSPEELAEAIRDGRHTMAIEAVRENLPCPACRGAMEPFNYGGDSGIILDKCHRCGGIWLDAGELDRVHLAVAASDLGLEQDLKRFSGPLHQVEVREDALEQHALRTTTTPLVTTHHVVDH
jgi:Zn-finger nucleic acid-binding protein